MTDRPSSSGFLLLAASGALLVLAVLRPPEIDAWSGLASSLLLAAALCAMTLRPASCGVSLPPWTAGLLPLAAAAILFSSCRAHALDEASAVAALVLAGLLGRTMASEPRGRPLVRDLVAVLGAVAALLAVVQAHVTLRQDLAELQAAPGALPAYVVARLESGRPSGPFTLPAALSGFLALSLPLTLYAATASRSRGPWRVAAIAFALLELYALILTRSVGGLAAAAVSVALTLPALAPARYKRPLLAAVPIAAALLAVLFLYARRAEVGAPGGDPLALRAGNWRAAAGMIHDHPLLGTGPGSFGEFYPRALRAGMNETRYAHNSYLQVMSGWGVWALLPLAGLVVALARRVREALRSGGAGLPFCAAAASFLVHNLVDFTAYLPGVALPAALVLGCALGPRAPDQAAPRDPRPARAWRAAVVSAALLFFLNHSVARARAKDLIENARAAALLGRKDAALTLARRAARARPDDPIPRAFIAEWVLTHGMQDEALRREGRRQAAEASRLDPESAVLHYDLSLYSRWAGEGGPAWREQWSAHLLFPLKEIYRLPPSPDSAGAP